MDDLIKVDVQFTKVVGMALVESSPAGEVSEMCNKQTEDVFIQFQLQPM